MDEESLSKFTDGADEELTHTKNYEEGRIGEDINQECDLLEIFDLAGTANEEQMASKPKKGQLPTLFERSPVDFIKGVGSESAGEVEGARIKIRTGNTAILRAVRLSHLKFSIFNIFTPQKAK